MPSAKVHLIKDAGPRGRGWVLTYCGMEGYDTDWTGEFETPVDVRFEAYPEDTRGEHAITCKRCLRASASPIKHKD